MKKTVKKLTAVGLTLTSVMSLVACGNKTTNNGGTEAGSNAGTEATSKEIVKPDKIKVVCDGTVVTDANGGKEFYTYLNSLIGVETEWTRPDHNTYYDSVANIFNSGDVPDVVLLSSDYYALYAANGYLWDMTEAWENSETKNSGRLIATADNILNALLVNGEDGEKAMYGFSPFRGNGCCTYVKAAWIKKAGMKVEDVKGKTMSFAEYYEFLGKLKTATGSNYVISAPGFIHKEAPNTNYLPEWYQKAQFTFYLKDGKYVDGFTQQEMKDALQRIQTAVKDGIIDKGTEGQGTADARNKFYSTDPTTESGVFTYWSGTWANTLKVNLESKGLDSELIALNPIKELGSYVERLSTTWAITAACKNPEGVFKYFIDTMLDGGEVQKAWEYGAKGTHWDTKAETVTLKDKPESAVTYKEGEFHFLPSPEKPNTMMKKNHIDPPLCLGELANGEKDPGKAAMEAVSVENAEFFFKNSKVAIPLPMTEVLANNIGDINTTRMQVISKVALGEWTVDQGMEHYTKTVGKLVEECIKSLNE